MNNRMAITTPSTYFIRLSNSRSIKSDVNFLVKLSVRVLQPHRPGLHRLGKTDAADELVMS